MSGIGIVLSMSICHYLREDIGLVLKKQGGYIEESLVIQSEVTPPFTKYDRQSAFFVL